MLTVLLKQPSHANSQATSTPTQDACLASITIIFRGSVLSGGLSTVSNLVSAAL